MSLTQVQRILQFLEIPEKPLWLSCLLSLWLAGTHRIDDQSVNMKLQDTGEIFPRIPAIYSVWVNLKVTLKFQLKYTFFLYDPIHFPNSELCQIKGTLCHFGALSWTICKLKVAQCIDLLRLMIGSVHEANGWAVPFIRYTFCNWNSRALFI